MPFPPNFKPSKEAMARRKKKGFPPKKKANPFAKKAKGQNPFAAKGY